MPLRLIFMGTPDIAVPTLLELVAHGHEIAAVYQNGEWLILDNLTNLLLRDSETKRLRADGYFGLQGCSSLCFGVLDRLTGQFL